MQLRKQWKQLTNEGLLSFKFKNQFSYNIIFCVKIYWREGNWCEKSSYWSRIGYQSVSNKLTLSNCSSIGLMHYLLFGFSLTIHDTGPFLVIPSWVLFNLYANNMEMLVFLFSLISATLIFFFCYLYENVHILTWHITTCNGDGEILGVHFKWTSTFALLS